MQSFESTREAKQFLVNSVVAQAKLEGAPLSKLEHDMLYFTESAWSPLEDCVATNDAFESEYDSEEYEQKIETLICNFLERSRKEYPNDFDAWKQAVDKISSEDHYLLVMITAANRRAGSAKRISRPLIYIGAIVLAIFLSFALVIMRNC